MAGLGNIGRMGVRAVLDRKGDALEGTWRTWTADQCGSCALGRTGQKCALAEIHARVEEHHWLPAEPPQSNNRRQGQDGDQRAALHAPPGAVIPSPRCARSERRRSRFLFRT